MTFKMCFVVAIFFFQGEGSFEAPMDEKKWADWSSKILWIKQYLKCR